MTAWTTGELDRIAAADELQIAPRDGAGTRHPTTIWVVRDGDDLYVRSVRGQDGGWYRAARSSHAGSISAGGVTKDVTFTEVTDPAVNEQIDSAYRTKYGKYRDYVAPMLVDPARSTTLRLQPN